MFHIHWHSSLQNLYGKNVDGLDEVFNQLLDSYWNGACVEKVFLPTTGEGTNFPRKLDDSLDDATVERMIALHTYISRGGAILVGARLESMGSGSEDDDYIAADSEDEVEENIDGLAISSVHSPYQYSVLTQEPQAEAVAEQDTERGYKYQTLLKSFQDTFEMTNGSPSAIALIERGLSQAADGVASHMNGRNVSSAAAAREENGECTVGAVSHETTGVHRRIRFGYEGNS